MTPEKTRLLIQLSATLGTLGFLYVCGKNRTSAADRAKLNELNERFKTRFRFVLDWWGYRLRVDALGGAQPSEDEAFDIGRLYWLDGTAPRKDCGSLYAMAFCGPDGGESFLLVFGHRDDKHLMATFLPSRWMGIPVGRKVSQLREIA